MSLYYKLDGEKVRTWKMGMNQHLPRLRGSHHVSFLQDMEAKDELRTVPKPGASRLRCQVQ